METRRSALGMLWMDTDPKKDLSTKLNEALAYFRKKNVSQPLRIEINPGELPQDLEMFSGIEIKGDQYILPYHYFLVISIGDQYILPFLPQPETNFFPS